MPHDVNALASEVVLIVKTALTPIMERLAAADARLATLGDLRDRVVTVETKSAIPQPALPVPDPPVDLTPLLERLASVEALLKQQGDLRDRVVVIETKAAVPLPAQPIVEPIDLSPILERLAATEARLVTLGDLRDRVVTIETKAAVPLPDVPRVDLAPVLERLSAVEMRLELKHAEAAADRAKDISMVRERLAVLETRELVPGPPGTPGQDGANGLNGKDGADGLGFDDLVAVQQDDRSFTLKALRVDQFGQAVKEIGTVRFPVEIYRGVHVDGKTYERGDCATFGGSEFHCNETTTSKPEQSKAWTLKVKRGRDGRDGVDAPGALPVVSVGRR